MLPATPTHPATHHPHSSLRPQNVSKLLEGSRFSYGTNDRRNRVVLLLSQLSRPIAGSQTPRVHPLLSPTYYLHPCKTPLAPPPIPGILSKCSVGGGWRAWGMMEMKGSRVLLLWGRQHMEATKSLGRPTADMWVATATRHQHLLSFLGLTSPENVNCTYLISSSMVYTPYMSPLWIPIRCQDPKQVSYNMTDLMPGPPKHPPFSGGSRSLVHSRALVGGRDPLGSPVSTGSLLDGERR